MNVRSLTALALLCQDPGSPMSQFEGSALIDRPVDEGASVDV
ncbi:MAG: hypothetical protein WCB85_10985 [Candidatus Dormiibacterota bacterium]